MAIDAVDDALLLLIAGRRHCVRAAGGLKRAAGLPLRDPQREVEVRARAARLGRRIGLGADTGERIAAGLIDAACIEQGIACAADLDQRDTRADSG
ncbi:MAG TPA: chorismate mutase, partial [Arenimonas sp.]|nr:chorismate mutase [Arenimonas sp.]